MSCRRCRARPFNLDPTVKLSCVFFRFAFIALHVGHNILEYVGAIYIYIYVHIYYNKKNARCAKYLDFIAQAGFRCSGFSSLFPLGSPRIMTALPKHSSCGEHPHQPLIRHGHLSIFFSPHSLSVSLPSTPPSC